jgi:putative ABC transport system ATP-binding protein
MLPLALAGRSHEQARAESLLDMVGLAKRSRHFPATLSGGEQQRVALARAFALSPRLLLADEPTGSLDAASGERVMALFFELQREHQTTVVVVTHDQSLAGRCDQLVQMRAGRIV